MTAALLLVLLAMSAQHAPSPEAGPAAPASSPAPHGSEEGALELAPEGATHGEGGPAAHVGPAEVLMHHVVDIRYGDLWVAGVNVGPTKHLAFFVLASVLVIGMIRYARSRYVDGVPSGLGAAIEALVVYVRDEIAEKNIGHDGAKYTPLLLSFFFLILIAALLGLVPLPTYDFGSGHWSIGGTTATGNISVTLGLAFVSFLAMQWAGISKYGVVHHFKNMVPSGLPMWLLPIMVPVELLGMFSRPFALMIRLFANMLAGHMVITSLLLLIPLMAAVATALGVLMIPISLGLALFIMILEILVAFIQAYIFTLLTSIFIGMSAHPAH